MIRPVALEAMLSLPLLPDSKAQRFEPLVILRPENVRIADTARVDSFSKIEGGEGACIGEFVHIASFCHLGIGGGTMILEDGSSFGSGAKIVTGSNVPVPGRGCSAIAPDAVIKRSFVHVKRNAVLFCGAIVLPGVTIGEGAIIAAGAVVNRDVPDGEMWGGVPARRLRPALTQPPHPTEFDWAEQFAGSQAEWYE